MFGVLDKNTNTTTLLLNITDTREFWQSISSLGISKRSLAALRLEPETHVRTQEISSYLLTTVSIDGLNLVTRCTIPNRRCYPV
ncbi:hypothetical protein J6590_042181 [Homalodisca vitripennis]|nr:hypothetical protein J6590_042181 [Homalodisca vitripennis]